MCFWEVCEKRKLPKDFDAPQRKVKIMRTIRALEGAGEKERARERERD